MSWSVLVVDDEPLTLNLLRLMLEPMGYRVTGVESGAEAVEKAVEILPDIMILDLMMPYMDGIEVCKQIRNNNETAKMPIIMLSGNFHRDAIERGLQAGANRYLAKPMSRTMLLQEMRDVLNETAPIPSPMQHPRTSSRNLQI